MAAKAPVILILGAGPNIGQAVARTFSARGYKVALASRSIKEADSTDDQLNISSDFSKTEDVVNAFTKVNSVLGIPSVVIYNGELLSLIAGRCWVQLNKSILASAVHFTPPEDPFALSLADLKTDTAINIYSPFVAAQQAVSGFAQLPDSAARAFIYTGNITNVAILPRFLSQGIGKSGGAHMIWAASAAYKDKGYK